MKISAFKASVLALTTLGSAAYAQTVVGPSNIEVAFYTDNNHFVADPPGPTPSGAQLETAGLTFLNVSGYGEVYDFCSEFFVGRDETVSYNVTSGFGSMNATQQANVQALLSNAIPAFNALLSAYTSQYGAGAWNANPAERAHLDAYGAGIQMALWEIINDTSGTLELDNSKAGKGIIALDLTATPTSATTLEGENNAINFVNNVKNGSWVNQGGLAYYYADSPNQQDRIWVQMVPEPSAALLGLVGMGLLVRRRRN